MRTQTRWISTQIRQTSTKAGSTTSQICTAGLPQRTAREVRQVRQYQTSRSGPYSDVLIRVRVDRCSCHNCTAVLVPDVVCTQKSRTYASTGQRVLETDISTGLRVAEPMSVPLSVVPAGEGTPALETRDRTASMIAATSLAPYRPQYRLGSTVHYLGTGLGLQDPYLRASCVQVFVDL
eukprot:696225-Rhodomonas_salina.3